MADMSLSSIDNLEPLGWTGTFQEYLDQVSATPDIAAPAHRRLYRMILAGGERDASGHYPFFADRLYGMEGTICRLVEDYLRPAALGFEVKKRILLLVGPVSGGKSTLVWMLKRGLEQFSRTDAGALYGITGCPMQEEPLHLIPDPLRPVWEARLGVPIEGQLCPVCRLQLAARYQGRFFEVPVQRVFLSEARRVGIGTYAPSDPKSQDISELTGSVDFHAIAQYGAESDPRAFRFDGELNIANRGLMEFQEMLKLDEKFLYHLLSLSQEGNFKTGRYELISADEVVIGHTNESEYKNFVQNPRNEALMSRLFVLPVPYTLDLAAEVKIYEKLLKPYQEPGRHLAPLTLQTAAAVSILSRIEELPKPGGDRLAKFQLYLGQGDSDRIQAARREGQLAGEGFKGLDPRFMMNCLAALLAKPDSGCVDARSVLAAIQDGLECDPFLDKKLRQMGLEWVELAREWYDRQVEQTVLKAFARDWSDDLHNLYQNYVDNVSLAVRGRVVSRGWDEALLRQVEERMGISEVQAPAFREEVFARLEAAKRHADPLSFIDHPALKRALEEKLLDDMRDAIKITTLAPVPDRRTLERIKTAISTLVEQEGYCAECAERVIFHVGGLMHR